jgi:DNA-binding MarR family transcriptional regulator
VIGREVLSRRAEKARVNRTRRGRYFDDGMFGEPAWDILLVLYATEQSGPRNTIARLCMTANVKLTTALRWLDYLEQQELVRRLNHPNDLRSVFIELTASGREAMDRYFLETVMDEL